MLDNTLKICGMILLVGFLLATMIWAKKVDYNNIANACKKTDYIAAHNCLTEDILMIDGVEKIRYLCNAESNSNDDV